MNWKIGQKLVCVYGFTYNDADSIVGSPTMPKKGDIVTYDGIGNYPGCIFLAEHKNASPRQDFSHDAFRPLLGESALSELLNMVQVSETSDCPIEVPQTETA